MTLICLLTPAFRLASDKRGQFWYPPVQSTSPLIGWAHSLGRPTEKKEKERNEACLWHITDCKPFNFCFIYVRAAIVGDCANTYFDWFKSLVPLFQPMKTEGKASRDLHAFSTWLTRVLPRFVLRESASRSDFTDSLELLYLVSQYSVA